MSKPRKKATRKRKSDDGSAQAQRQRRATRSPQAFSRSKSSPLISEWFDKMRRAYEKEGYKSKAYLKAQEAIQTELMNIRFTARTVERLCDTLRAQVDEVRQVERQILPYGRQQVRHAARRVHHAVSGQ